MRGLCERSVRVRSGSTRTLTRLAILFVPTELNCVAEEREPIVSKLLLVPLDDIVVFPNMNVTLTVDVGDEERVLLVPKHEGEYAAVGTVARVTDRVRLPGGTTAVALEGLHRGVAGAAETDARGRLFVEVEERRDSVEGRRPAPRARDRVPRRRRGDPRAARRRRPHPGLRPLDRRAGRARRHVRLLARPELSTRRSQLLETVDVAERLELALKLQRERLSLMQIRRADPRGRQRRDGEAAARVPAAQADGLDPQGARRGRRVRRRGVPDEDRGGRDAGGGARAGRQGARALRADGRELARVADDPQLPRLAARSPVGHTLGGGARPDAHARGARRRPRRSRGRQGPDRRVHRRREAAQGARHRGRQARRRDPDADRASRDGQDLDRRVDREGAQPRVRADVARRRSRRGGDPRPPAHVHRRAARAGSCARSATRRR